MVLKMKSIAPLLPFLFFTALFFFFNNDIDRFEDGSIFYTITKCLPILSLSFTALAIFEKSKNVASTGVTIIDKILQRPAATSFFLSAIGDYFLANRSNSLRDFIIGIVPFGSAHLPNARFHFDSENRRYWWPPLGYLIVHNLILALATFRTTFYGASVAFQISTLWYALVLTWAVWYFSKDHVSSLYMVGYCIFMWSDSTIMIDQFSFDVPHSLIYILIAYYLSQALIFQSFLLRDLKMKSE